MMLVIIYSRNFYSYAEDLEKRLINAIKKDFRTAVSLWCANLGCYPFVFEPEAAILEVVT